eukprot:GILJ01005741.1.p1 GENE.GILJ01005741.1~~GILJ01005741.1.p1  ORF type:complete len:321 (-),score=20.21 GILJ01005741.1:152-1114(-)
MTNNHVLIDLFAGTVGGVAGIVVGQPLDTVRVRYQTRPDLYKGSVDCLQKTFKWEGMRGFFKGMSSPIIGNAPLNALLFAVQGSSSRFLDRHFPEMNRNTHLYITGTYAGFMSTFVTTPMELLKVKMQCQHGIEKPAYNNYTQCIQKVVQSHGIQGLYRGWWGTMWRDAPSFGFYFLSYDLLKREFKKRNGLSDSDHLPLWQMMVAGGVSGQIAWLACYPLDVIKSCVQAQVEDPKKPLIKMSTVYKNLMREGGVRALYRGLITTVVRAFPVNAVTFAVYDSVHQWLHRVAENDHLTESVQLIPMSSATTDSDSCKHPSV